MTRLQALAVNEAEAWSAYDQARKLATLAAERGEPAAMEEAEQKAEAALRAWIEADDALNAAKWE